MTHLNCVRLSPNSTNCGRCSGSEAFQSCDIGGTAPALTRSASRSVPALRPAALHMCCMSGLDVVISLSLSSWFYCIYKSWRVESETAMLKPSLSQITPALEL